MAKKIIVVELELDDNLTVEEAAEFAAHQLMNEEVDFDVNDIDGTTLGTFNTADFA